MKIHKNDNIAELFQIAAGARRSSQANTKQSSRMDNTKYDADTYSSSLDELSIVDITGLPELKAIDNILTIPNIFCLGFFSGIEVNMRITYPGGFETTNNPCLPGPYDEGMQVTPEQKRMSAIFDSFLSDYKNISDTAYFVHNLWSVSNGRFKMEELNPLMHNPAGNTTVDIKYQLERLGIDINKPFTINGNTFVLDEKLNFILL